MSSFLCVGMAACLKGFFREGHPFSRGGVLEGDAFGMKIEAVGSGAVKDIAFDGTP